MHVSSYGQLHAGRQWAIRMGEAVLPAACFSKSAGTQVSPGPVTQVLLLRRPRVPRHYSTRAWVDLGAVAGEA